MWVIPLNSIDLEDPAVLRQVGGKALGLRQLIASGFRVPNGYVVSTEVFRHTLRGALVGIKTPERLAEAVQHVALPAQIEDAIRGIHREQFNGHPVAVRSSATDEDSAEYSFAGQLESVLEVKGEDALIEAIRTVWASYFNRANLLYRGRVALDGPGPRVAVVVQEMIKPRSAGVLFTADPVSGDPERMVISASAGLGDAVVGGRATETVYVHAPTRTVVQHVIPDGQSSALLMGADLDALVEAGLRVKSSFDSPQDVEWALDERGAALLQSRAITTGRRGEHPGGTVWSNANVGEALPGVATPMTWSIIRAFSRRGFEKAFGAMGLAVPEEYGLVGSFRGRIYLNLSEFASIVSQIPFFDIASLMKVAGVGETELIGQLGYQKRSKAGFLAKLPLTLSRMAVSQLTAPVRARRWRRAFRRQLVEYRSVDLSGKSRRALVDVLGEIDRAFDKTGIVMLACGSNFLGSYLVMQTLLQRWGGREAAAKEHHLFSGLRGLASAEPGLDLLEMARFVRSRPALKEQFAHTPSDELLALLDESADGRQMRRMLDEFLDHFGERGPGEAEISTPRWSETPNFLLDVIRSHLEAPYLPSSEDFSAQRAQARQENTELVRQYFRPGLGVVFRQVLSKTQENARLREATRACVTDTLGMYRRLFLEAGRRLVATGVLAEPDDVFFLTRQEVEVWLRTGRGTSDMALDVATRRAEFVAFGDSPDPPDTFVMNASDPIPEEHHEVAADVPYLQGLPASPGRVTGPARVIRDLTQEAHLHPGEILVAPFTDVGWTPLFLVANGVVTDMGGPLSHAAVVAREYGVSAVVNTKDATTAIRTGDLITVDGDTGRVYLQSAE